MRALARLLFSVMLVAGATTARAAEKKPTAAQTAEIQRLEKELYQHQVKQDYPATVPIARQLYELQCQATGPDSRAAHNRKLILGNLLQGAARYGEALELFGEMLKTAEAETGPDSRDTLQALASISAVYWVQSRYDDIYPLQQRMLEITKKLDGEKSQAYAGEVAQLGSLYNFRSEFGQAQRCYEESLAIQEALPGNKDSLILLGAVQTLAYFYWMTNQQQKAIAFYDRAITISRTAKDTNALVEASTVWGIASMYHYGHRDDLAAPLTKQAVDLYEKEIARREKETPDDPQLPTLLGQLGFVYRQTGDLTRAEATLKRAVAVGRKRTGFSGWESPLADIERASGKKKEALDLLLEAKASTTKVAPMSSGVYDISIAEVLRDMGQLPRAEKVIRELLQSVLKRYGARHPYYGAVLLEATRIYASAGDIREAERALTEALELSEKELGHVLRAGTEADHAVYFARNGYQLDTAIDFQLNYAPKSASAARLGLTTLLRRKGRVLDAAAASMATLRAKLGPEDKKLLDELGSARAELAKLTLAGPGAADADYAKRIATLEDRLEKLELQISTKSAAYRLVSQPIELSAVQKMIPRDARLVELVNFQPYDVRAPYALNPVLAPRRYAAYVVGERGDPTLVELGDAGAIDRAVEAFRKAVSDPDNDRAVELGHALYRLTMAKVIPALGGATNLLVAPDGALNLVPFSALVDDAGQFLIKKYTFTYPTSGRDLLRLKVLPKSQGGGVIFADPAFDTTSPAPSAPDGGSRGRRSLDLASVTWPRLPGTSQEADQVGKTMPGLKILRGDEATEGAVKAVHGPRILHLATHGFFLPDEPPPPHSDDAGGAALPGVPAQAPPPENPLLRSGLALAGANKLRSGDEDGILTALEASGLDLVGTKLVVLSACETGVGKVTNGEGVYGLRRALVIAGAESLVMTLWQVDDLATRDLMTGYYARLQAGRGRGAALRDTQLAIAAQAKYAHPYFWASFLAAGADAPLRKD
jgi:CHAT domain-containing protein